MKRFISSALLLAGFILLAGAYASDASYADARLGALNSGMVRATVMSNTLDTVKLFVPEGSEAVCKGESIPVYRIKSGFKGKLSPRDLSGLKLVGEVRVDYIVGDSYAQGSLVTGEADPGDLVIKPDESCLKG